MDPVVEAMQILRIDEQHLFQSAHGWFYGSRANGEMPGKQLHEIYRATRVYPACVLAYVATVRRNGGRPS